MAPISSLVVYGTLLLQSLVAATPFPRYFQNNPITRRNLTTSVVQRELGHILSNNTLIFGPESPEFPEASSRWNEFVQPHVEIIVEPAQEADISKIVRYCNDNSIDFLVKNRGHGFTTSLNAFKGLQINMIKLQGVDIAANGQTALLQGGSFADPTVRALWDKGYVTNEVGTNFSGRRPWPPGGSLYGLAADGVVHFNVVTSDGSEIGVNATSHRDLFWAMRGAGHNFGIVTSSRVKIHPRPKNTWHYHSYTWTGDKLEAVFEEINKLHKSVNGSAPVLLGMDAGVYTLNQSISKTEPVIFWDFAYNGPAEEAEAMLQPFNAIEAVLQNVRDVPYDQISDVAGTGLHDHHCEPGSSVFANALLREYNVTTQRRLYDLFARNLAQYPVMTRGTLLAHEGYGNKAVQQVPSPSTAYPHREQNFIVYLKATVPEGSGLLEPARAWAKETFDLLMEGQGPGQTPKTYVNYAWGHPWETAKSMYGDEPWRLALLKRLKAKYDPSNRFRFYNPIVAAK
ncbi:FAD-binding domain-containing protein [Apiospora hydei]|uniref:FAD-binding domain-containing protein n=1 Tax=Apiospora hydei TaxID=1337664 RepID=A0ABR1X2K7_9PEZI